jgi:hypothetical protein
MKDSVRMKNEEFVMYAVEKSGQLTDSHMPYLRWWLVEIAPFD